MSEPARQADDSIRVLHVGPGHGQRGGIASVLAELAAQQPRFLEDAVVFSFFDTHGFQSVADGLHFIFGDLPRFAMKMLGRVDIVHFHVSVRGSFYRKFLLFLLAKLAGKRTIFHLHAGNFDRFTLAAPTLARCAIRRFAGGSDAAIAVSQATAAELAEYRATRGELYVIGNTACDAEALSVAGMDATVSGSVPYVAFAGRLVETKGLDDLLRALALLNEQGCPVRLKLAGSGDTERWMKAAAAYGVDDCVEMTGWLEGQAKLAFLAHARVFCMPSHYESFGIATLEAMFMRVPVIGTRLGGFLDLVQDGVTGYLVEPHSPVQLAGRLRLLMEDPQHAARCGQAGFVDAQRRYSSEAVARQYIQCYRRLAARRSRSNDA